MAPLDSWPQGVRARHGGGPAPSSPGCHGTPPHSCGWAVRPRGNARRQLQKLLHGGRQVAARGSVRRAATARARLARRSAGCAEHHRVRRPKLAAKRSRRRPRAWHRDRPSSRPASAANALRKARRLVGEGRCKLTPLRPARSAAPFLAQPWDGAAQMPADGGRSRRRQRASAVQPRRRPVSQGDLHYASLLDVSQLIRTRRLSSVEATEAQLARIEALDGRLHSYATVTADRARAGAQGRRRDRGRALSRPAARRADRGEGSLQHRGRARPRAA